jgi:dihydropteroate synthase
MAIVSIDTYKAPVAEAAVKAGADVVNDVSGFQWDPDMAKTLAKLGCGTVLMHTRGLPDEWSSLPAVADMVLLIKRELRARADAALLAGLKRDRLVLDPGLGVGKRCGGLSVAAGFGSFSGTALSAAAGVSRKAFLGGESLAQNGG